MPGARLLVADAREGLRFLGAGSVDVVVTSPPYWAKARYTDDRREIGLGDLADYLADMCVVFDEILRVLAPTGVVWLNVGDTACVDEETEILTLRGWLTVDQLEVGDVALTLEPATGMAQWQPVQALHRYEAAVRWMLRMEQPGAHSSMTTANHRWLLGDPWDGEDGSEAWQSGAGRGTEEALVGVGAEIRRPARDAATGYECDGRAASASCSWTGGVSEIRSDELTGEAWLPVAAPLGHLPGVQKWPNALVEAVAWYCSEGQDHCVDGSARGLAIVYGGVQHTTRHRVRESLSSLFGPGAAWASGWDEEWEETPAPRWSEEGTRSDGSIGWHLNRAAAGVVRQHAPERVVSAGWLSELTQAQLELFVEASLAGEPAERIGDSAPACDPDLFRRRAEAFQIAVILSGRHATLGPCGACRGSLPADGACAKWGVHVDTRRFVKLEDGQRTWVVHAGRVWCPQTQNGTWMARRNGVPFFTGNSGSGGAGGDYVGRGSRAGDRKYRQGDPGLAKRQWCSVPFRLAHVLQERGWLLRSTVIWDKGMSKREDLAHARRPGETWEPIFLLVPERPNRNGLVYEFDWGSMTEMGNVWHFPPAHHPSHPAVFPNELVRRCLEPFPSARTVLDPFCGSGTVLQAAVESGRNAIGVDVDPENVALVRARLGLFGLSVEEVGPCIRQAAADV